MYNVHLMPRRSTVGSKQSDATPFPRKMTDRVSHREPGCIGDMELTRVDDGCGMR
jgi:hypothetical protein